MIDATRILARLLAWCVLTAPLAASAQDAPAPEPGDYDPERGFVVARGSQGELGITLWTYVRYLNQRALDESYTDSFGRTAELDRRQDIEHQKVNLTFAGWIHD